MKRQQSNYTLGYSFSNNPNRIQRLRGSRRLNGRLVPLLERAGANGRKARQRHIDEMCVKWWRGVSKRREEVGC